MSIFDETLVEDSHKQLLGVQPGKDLIGALGHATSLIRENSLHGDFSTNEQLACAVLGNRISNCAGACSKMLDAGYFVAAAVQLRDIAETTVLLRYFEYHPDKIELWMTTDQRYRNFRFGMIKDAIPEDKFQAYWGNRFALWSEYGGHPSIKATFAVHDGENFHLGPHVDERKYMALLHELAQDVCMAVPTYIETMDKICEAKVQDRVPEADAAFHKAVPIVIEHYKVHGKALREEDSAR